jgi:hypothetical protein
MGTEDEPDEFKAPARDREGTVPDDEASISIPIRMELKAALEATPKSSKFMATAFRSYPPAE